MSSQNFSEKEFQYLTDTNFLITKKEITDKIRSGLKNCSDHIDQELRSGQYLFNKDHLEIVPKISVGENYKDLPYMVLDNPRYFKKDCVLSYRVLLWWGHFISFSLHMEGPGAIEALHSIISKKKNIGNDTYYCVGKTPWEYHFEKHNYEPLEALSSNEIELHFERRKFLKIARKATLNEWPLLNDLAISNLQLFAELTSLVRQF